MLQGRERSKTGIKLGLSSRPPAKFEEENRTQLSYQPEVLKQNLMELKSVDKSGGSFITAAPRYLPESTFSKIIDKSPPWKIDSSQPSYHSADSIEFDENPREQGINGAINYECRSITPKRDFLFQSGIMLQNSVMTLHINLEQSAMTARSGRRVRNPF
jgi:hypothetical protein